MSIGVFFRAGCFEGREREREEASNDSGKEGRMGAEREDGSKEKKWRK